MSKRLAQKIADRMEDLRLDELCASREEELFKLQMGAALQQAEEAVEKKFATGHKKPVVLKRYYRTGSNPNAGLEQIMRKERFR